MDKKIHLLIIFLVVSSVLFRPANLYAPWVWTPETGWINEKDIVKDTPREQLEYAASFEKEEKYDRAARAYKALIKEYSGSPIAIQAQFKLAENYEKSGQLYEAFQAYQKLFENHPKEIDLEEILNKQYEIGQSFVQGKKRKFAGLPILPAQDKGIEILKTIVENAPFSETAPQAQYALAAAYRRTGKYEDAVAAYRKIVNDYKNSPWYKEALYQDGWCNYRNSKGISYDQPSAEDAVKAFTAFLEKFPDDQRSPKVKELLNELTGRQAKGILEIAYFYEKNKHYEAAIKYYKETMDNFPYSNEAAEAEKKIERLKKRK